MPAPKKPTKPKTTAKAASKATAKAAPKKATKPTKTSAKKTSRKAETDDEFENEGKTPKRGLKLVIVESPSKASTIKKILGPGYQVKASVGHIRDLPKSKLGVSVENNFEPMYQVMEDKMQVVKDLQTAAGLASEIYLAPDPDREGEAIAWHIAALVKDSKKPIKRIEFHEITKTAIQAAIQNPREIDYNKVDAQQARRVLDRLVGYKLSPLLWRKVAKGLSAGRVQSVAVRVICEREEEILAFIPVEYWTMSAKLSPKSLPSALLDAELSKVDGKKPEIPNEAEATRLKKIIENATLVVKDIKERKSTRQPSPPFITSTLQREASNRFGFAVKRTMQVAQKLYEGLDFEGKTEGLITYMRTDSTRIADEAQAEAKDFILNKFGKDFYPGTPRVYASKKKNVQDAHEAIRPTSVHRTPEMLQNVLSPEQHKLYKLIWDRFVSSQMEAAQLLTNSIETAADNLTLRSAHTKVIFKGYLAVYRSDDDEADADEASQALPDLKVGDAMLLKSVEPKQHFTEPPPRFTEASLVKVLEELGIGRPSTYAPTISTIQDRHYVLKEEKTLRPTEMGKTVTTLLKNHFADVVNLSFTAEMETKLDLIEEQGIDWHEIVAGFYFPFEKELEKAETNVEKVVMIYEGVVCSACESPMQIKTSRWGSQFLGCTAYPECKVTMPLSKDNQVMEKERPSEEMCEKCQTQMVIKLGRYGEYLSCPNEDCKATRKIVVKTGVTCPTCQKAELVQRKSRYGKFFYGCGGWPDCNFVLWAKPTGNTCPDCNSLTVDKQLKKGHFEACSSKECKWSRQLEDVAASGGEENANFASVEESA